MDQREEHHVGWWSEVAAAWEVGLCIKMYLTILVIHASILYLELR